MPVIDTIQPLSTTTTTTLSSNPSQQDVNSTTNTQLEQAIAQKVAANLRPREMSASAAVLGNCLPHSQSLHDQNKMVQFAGLYVVRGPTESKHLRYTMDVADELQLRGRCIQRFQSFFVLRKKLLQVLKTCRLNSRKSTLTGEVSPGAELVQILTRPRSIQCCECEATFTELSSVKFPRRTLFAPSLEDVQERAQMLELFLDFCVRIATTWPACDRSKRMFVFALSQFLGVDLMKNLNFDQDFHEKLEKIESSSEIVYLPSPHEISDTIHSSDDVEERNSEPNCSFISNSKEGMVRSLSHC